MRVKWSVALDLPESYWDQVAKSPELASMVPLYRHYQGEVIGTVRAFCETRVVVMLDNGELKEVAIDEVKRCE